jgi:hypothetical protein
MYGKINRIIINFKAKNQIKLLKGVENNLREIYIVSPFEKN